MLRTSVSPNIIQAGYRINVIPSEATARLDVRALQDENMPAMLEAIKKGRERSHRRGEVRAARHAAARQGSAASTQKRSRPSRRPSARTTTRRRCRR
jgi:metal-dependent amidase/aminoacylase/carboxypeptidase family protein